MTEEEVKALQDELASSKEAVASLETEKQSLTGELETLKGELEAKGTGDTLREEIGVLEAAVAERDAKLGEVQGELVKFTGSVAGKDEKLKAGEVAVGEITVKLEAATEGLASAVQSYKALVLEANPAVPGELITGGSIEEMEQSLEKAKGIVGKVKEGLAAEAQAVTVPAGAPARTEPDLSSLSSTEKIKYAIARNGK